MLRAIITFNGAFYQRRSGCMTECLFDGGGEFASVGGTEAMALAIIGVEHVHNASIVPFLYVVIRSVVDLHLDCIAMIVDQEDDDRQLQSDHLANLLGSDLEGAVAYHQDNPAARCR